MHSLSHGMIKIFTVFRPLAVFSMSYKKSNRTRQRGSLLSQLANSTLVSNFDQDASNSASSPSSQENFTTVTVTALSVTPIASQIETDGLFRVRESLIKQGFSSSSVNIILSLWRSSVQKQYATYIKRWFEYCKKHRRNPLNSHVNIAVQF